MTEFIEVNLLPGLIDPWKRDMGTRADISNGGISVRIGQRPTALDLRKLYKKTKKKLPENLILYEDYNIYLITHTVGVLDMDLIKNINTLGYRVQYNDEDEIVIIDVLPKTKFIKKMEAGIGVQADLCANGSLQVPEQSISFTNETENISFGGGLNLSIDSGIVGRISFDVITPSVTAIGEGDFIGEWIFRKEEKPLVGMHKMTQTILVPEGITEIEFKSMVYATMKTFDLLPDRRKSRWVKLECKLS